MEIDWIQVSPPVFLERKGHFFLSADLSSFLWHMIDSLSRSRSSGVERHDQT